MQTRTEAAVSLVASFAAVGLSWGWICADAFPVTVPMRASVALTTAVTAGLLGRWQDSRLRGGPGRLLAIALLALVAAGMLDGLALGVGAWLFLSDARSAGALLVLLLGVPVGAVFALPLAPVLASIVLTARRVGRARPGSLVDAADRRAVALPAALGVAAGALLPGHHRGPGHDLVALLLPLGAAMWIASVLARDAAAHRRVVRGGERQALAALRWALARDLAALCLAAAALLRRLPRLAG